MVSFGPWGQLAAGLLACCALGVGGCGVERGPVVPLVAPPVASGAAAPPASSSRVAPLLLPTPIAAGWNHACVIRAGAPFCWGDNGSGQLGDGTTQSRFVATRVVGIDDAVDVAAGRRATCVIRAGGQVSCWGAHGLGAECDSPRCATPTPISNLCSATHIAVGEQHACAVCSTGQVMCWGHDDSGELGVVGAEGGLARAIPGLNNALGVATGSRVTCVLRRQGDVQCWGREASGEPPQSLAGASRSVPGTAGATAISASDTRVCVLQPGGAVRCWQWEPDLGAGEVESRVVFDAPDSAELASGGSHGCVRTQAGLITCFDGNERLSKVEAMNDASALAVGSGFACAVRRSGTVSCWGRNENGALGNGETAWFVEPVAAEGVADAEGVTIGNSTCARLRSGKVLCWGTEASGATPREVPGLTDAVRLYAATDLSCAVRAKGDVLCWSEPGEPPQVLPAGAERMAGSGALMLAMQGGKIFYFGRSSDGSLARVAMVDGVSNALDVSANGLEGCALRRSGELTCWRRPSDLPPGQAFRPKLQRVSGLRDAELINGSCALRRNGSAACWVGATAQAWNFENTALPGDPVTLSSGRNSKCVVDTRGSVLCSGEWAWDRDSTRGRLEINGRVLGVSDAVRVATGEHHACVATASGKVQCWGWNRNGALARHEAWYSASPVDVAGLQTGSDFATAEPRQLP